MKNSAYVVMFFVGLTSSSFAAVHYATASLEGRASKEVRSEAVREDAVDDQMARDGESRKISEVSPATAYGALPKPTLSLIQKIILRAE